jgi:uncharacterized protein DUF6629
MCFSAEASFATSAVLMPAGIFCIRRAVGRRDYLPLAVIPVMFSFQQFCEGLVWVGLARGDPDLVRRAALAFLLFALVLWPFWIPFSALFREARRSVRHGLGLIAAAALVISLLLYVPLAMHACEWLRAGILHHSIVYEFEMASAFRSIPRGVWQLSYLMVVITPLIVTDDRRFRVFGVLLLASAALSQAAYWYAFISVWCAFSAMLSGWLCYLFALLPSLPTRHSDMGPNPHLSLQSD